MDTIGQAEDADFGDFVESGSKMNGAFGDFQGFDAEESGSKKDENFFEEIKSQEATNGTVDVDDFGDFTGGTNPASNDEDFGDFTGGVNPVTSDDDFGGFESFQANSMEGYNNEENLTEPKTEDTAVSDADFGDFDAAPSTTEPSHLDEGEDDDFGDFGEAPAGPKQNETVVSTDDFGDFDAAPSATEPSHLDDDGEDDNFGDFGEAPAGPKQNKTVVSNDDFGDFDAAPSATEPSHLDEGEDDDFGDFGEAPAGPKQNETVVSDDDFGDFDAAPSVPPSHIDDDGAEDDLGEATLEPQPEQTSGDDDFGDFDAAPLAPQIPQGDEHADDDFGDFGEATTGGTSSELTQNQADDEEDFGDFGEAPAARKSNNAAEEDDYGDFDTVSKEIKPQTHTQRANGDDVGDYGTTQSQSVQLSQTPAAAFTEGKDTQNSTSIFVHMQQKYTFDDVGLPDHNQDDLLNGFSIQDFLDTLVDNETGELTEENTGAVLLTQVLKDNQSHQESRCKTIIEKDGHGLYNHFTYPVGGLQVSDYTKSKVQKRTSTLPDMLALQLSVGNQMPLEASSPSPKNKKTVQNPAMQAVPILEVPSLGTQQTNGSSGKVQNLLSRIPDLSFMLESSLSLPKK